MAEKNALADALNRHSAVSEFRDELMKINPKLTFKQSVDPFAIANKLAIEELVGVMLEATEEVTEKTRIGERQKGERATLDELVDHWIDYFSKDAYRLLAESINIGVSHAASRISRQAEANAAKQVADALRNYRDYGSKLSEDFSVAVRP